MIHRYNNIICISITTIITVSIILMRVSITGLQIIAGVFLALILPGYALVTLINSSEKRLEIADQILLTFGMSIVIDILVGLILNQFNLGLNIYTWALFLGSMVISINFLTALSKPTNSIIRMKGIKRIVPSSQAFLFSLSIIIILFAIGNSRLGALRQTGTYFTQLWIQPTVQTDSYIASIGIESFEEKRTIFRLQFLIDGRAVREWEYIVLEPKDVWEYSLALPTPVNAKTIEVKLYRLEDEKNIPYRRVLLSIVGR